MREIERDIVSAVLISKDTKIFQGLKDPNGGGSYAGYWVIPGGGIDEGEDKLGALIREVHEEAGIDISLYTPIPVHETHGETVRQKTGEQPELVKMHFYTYQIDLSHMAVDIEVDIETTGEFIEYQWTEPSLLSEMKMPTPSEELFRHLGYLA